MFYTSLFPSTSLNDVSKGTRHVCTLPLRRNKHQIRRNVLNVPPRTLKCICINYGTVTWQNCVLRFGTLWCRLSKWVDSIALLNNGAMLYKPLGCIRTRYLILNLSACPNKCSELDIVLASVDSWSTFSMRQLMWTAWELYVEQYLSKFIY